MSLDTSKPIVDDIKSKIGEDSGMNEMLPYQNVFLQECEVMAVLIDAIIKSVQEIRLALNGELTMSEQMEQLMNDVFANKVPPHWMALSFESTRGLEAWLISLKARLDQLNTWKEDPYKIPVVTWLNRLKNPQSFLTAKLCFVKNRFSFNIEFETTFVHVRDPTCNVPFINALELTVSPVFCARSVA